MTRANSLIGLSILAAALMTTQTEIASGATPDLPAQPVRTVTGIPLDAPWKQKLYAFARGELKHPAWGWTHSERDYLTASEIAAEEHLAIDTDVLFAAAFTHDIGAIGDFQKEGVDHAVRSVELAEPLLREAGFPAEKLPAVREAILGHMHDKIPGSRSESVVLHDADTLDFLGTVGVARRLAVTGTATDYAGGVARIGEFADKLPGRLVTPTAKAMAAPRVAEMRRFLDQLAEETRNGRLP
jgi:uncharacterized protein